jgi:general secretion pathway protein M
MTLPVGTRGRIVAVCLVLIPLILVFNFGIKPMYKAYIATGDDILAAQSDISRYRRIIGELPALKAAMAQFDREQPLAPFLLAGSNPALAAAGLQRRLQEIAGKSDIRIVSVRVQPPVPDGPLERISVQARLSADTAGLRDILYELEANRPYVFVDDLTITARPRRRNVSDDVLDIRISLSGLRTPDAVERKEISDG